MAEKVVYVPLDDRPCNYDFPGEIFAGTVVSLRQPPLAAMGNKKQAGDFYKLKDFLLEECRDAYGLVISIDMLLYGGIVPSRLHNKDEAELASRLNVLNLLRKSYPCLIIYAFSLIMRAPQTSSSEEEPDYYALCGREIYLSGYYEHKQRLGIISASEKEEQGRLIVKKQYLCDYRCRRRINGLFNEKVISLAEKKIIDFLVIPQDDAGEYGYPSMDQEKLRAIIKKKQLMMNVCMYPGADEAGCTLLTRMLNRIMGKTPRIYVRYPSPGTPFTVPALEDRFLDVTVRYHIMATGGVTVTSLADADIVMLVLMGAEKMIPRPDNASYRNIDVLSNMTECFDFGRYTSRLGYPPVIADVLYLNAGSLDVLGFLKESRLLTAAAAYAGFNTASNTLGMALAQGTVFSYYGATPGHKRFLVKRYVEDIIYAGIVRREITNDLADYGLDYFNTGSEKGRIALLAEEKMNKYFRRLLPELCDEYVITDVSLPWRRMFEVRFKVEKL